jgi:hypothetical protein
MKTIITILALLAPVCPYADVGCIGSDSRECQLTLFDVTLQASFVALMAIDWAMTEHELRSHSAIEQNPILGHKPTTLGLATYNVLVMSGHAAIAYILPRPYRTVWQSIGIGIQGKVVYMKIKFNM